MRYKRRLNVLRAVLLGVLLALLIGALASRAETEGYQDRYLIASEACERMSHERSERTYRSLDRLDASAARVWADAARDNPECPSVRGRSET